MRCAARWVLLVALLLAGSAPGRAQGPIGSRRIGVRWEGRVPTISFSARDLVNVATRRKLDSGLPQTTVMRVYAYRPGVSRPVAVTQRSCRIVYDLWEEVYRLQIQTPDSDRTVTVRGVDAVLQRCLTARQMPVGQAAQFRARAGTRLYFAVLVELNPISPETVQRMRRWLARPNGRVQSEAFFGSFVSLFVNRSIGAAERTLRFRSQSEVVP